MSKRPPSLEAKRTLRLIETILGTTRLQGIVVGILVIVSIGWFGDSVSSLFDSNINLQKTLSGLFFMPLLLVILVLYIRNIEPNISIDVKPDINPPQAQVLILILSPPRGDENILLTGLNNKLEKNSTTLKKFNGWRMPMEAIAHHLGRLKRVIVITSADHSGINRDTRAIEMQPGTWNSFEKFKKIVTAITPTHNLTIQSIGDINQAYAKGINFEHIDTLTTAIDGIYKKLKQEKIPGYDILIDITGGMKPPGIAGAIVALAEGRRFQYVSTIDKKVMTFDITYE